MCTYAYVHTYAHSYIHIYLHTSNHACMHIMRACMHTYMQIFMHIRACACALISCTQSTTSGRINTQAVHSGTPKADTAQLTGIQHN